MARPVKQLAAILGAVAALASATVAVYKLQQELKFRGDKSYDALNVRLVAAEAKISVLLDLAKPAPSPPAPAAVTTSPAIHERASTRGVERRPRAVLAHAEPEPSSIEATPEARQDASMEVLIETATRKRRGEAPSSIDDLMRQGL